MSPCSVRKRGSGTVALGGQSKKLCTRVDEDEEAMSDSDSSETETEARVAAAQLKTLHAKLKQVATTVKEMRATIAELKKARVRKRRWHMVPHYRPHRRH